jgi:hypothetical protein
VVIAVFFLVLGLVLMVAQQVVSPAFFRQRPETASAAFDAEPAVTPASGG